MKLVVIRRPETNKNAGLPGEQEAPSPKGREQLSKVAETCRSEAVQVVFHSAEPRSFIAAMELAKSLGVSAKLLDGLEERNFGDWNDWEWPQIANELDKLSAEDRYAFVPPNGESWQQMEVRLMAVLKSIFSQGYESAAIMTHWGPMRVLLPILNGDPRESTLQLNVENGEMFIEQYDGGAR